MNFARQFILFPILITLSNLYLKYFCSSWFFINIIIYWWFFTKSQKCVWHLHACKFCAVLCLSWKTRLKTKTLINVNLRMWKLKLWRNGKHKVKVFRRFGNSFYLSHDERTASKTMNVKPSKAPDRKQTLRTSQRTDGRVRHRWKMSERQGSAQTRSVIRVFLFKILLISVNLSWTRVE